MIIKDNKTLDTVGQNFFKIAVLIFFYQPLFAQADKEAQEKIRAAFFCLDTCRDFGLLHKACQEIVFTSSRCNMINDYARGVVESELLFDFYLNVDSLGYWLSVGDTLFSKHKLFMRSTLYDSLSFRHEFQKAKYQQHLGDHEQALFIYDCLWDKWQTGKFNNPESTFYTDLAMRFAAQILKNQGRHAEAADLYWRSLQLYKAMSEQTMPDQRVLIYATLADALAKDGQLDAAQLAWQNAFIVSQKNIKAGIDSITSQSWNLSVYLNRCIAEINQFGRPDSANYFLEKSNQLMTRRSTKLNQAKLQYVQGLMAEQAQDFERAKNFYNQCINNLLEEKGASGEFRLLSQLRLVILKSKDDLTGAIEYLDHIIKTISNSPNQQGLNLKSIYYKKYMLQALALKTKLLLNSYYKTKDSSLLDSTLQNGALQLNVLNSFLGEFAIEQDKLVLIEMAYHGLEYYWQALLEKYHETGDDMFLYSIFELQNKAKNRVGLEKIMNSRQLREAGIKNHEMEELQKKRYKADYLENKIANLSLSAPERADFQMQYSIASDDARKCFDTLKKKYSALQNETRQSNAVNARKVQSLMLGNTTALIQYFDGDSSIFSTVLTSNGIFVFEKRKPFGLDKLKSQLNESITNPKAFGRSGLTDFQYASGALFQLLLKQEVDVLRPEIQNLIIISDGFMGEIPFELLGDSDLSEVSFKSYPYLLRKYSISYTHSIPELLLQLEFKPENNRMAFAGFAPEYGVGINEQLDQHGIVRGEGADLNHLPGAVREVQEVKDLLGGDSYLGKKAAIDTFKRHCNDYKCFLLAMHAIPNYKYPNLSKLLFSPDTTGNQPSSVLTTSDIQQLSIPADLVVLSACQTGIGRIRRGEGMLSLTRGFITAGVKSVVMSLWKVPDSTTPAIIIGFFKHLKSGKSKAEALRQSKLDYLNNPEFKGKENPCFWAGFVLTGDFR